MERRLAADRLKPYLHLFSKCIEHGWEQWETKYLHKNPVLDARARAAIVYCEIKEEAMRVFDQVDDVVLRTKNGSVLIYIGGDILVRFKKLRKSGRASNIMTSEQLSLYGQRPIPGFLPGNHFNAGYVLDELQQSIERLLLVYQQNKRVVWTIDIDSDTGTAAEVVVMPTTPAQPKTGKRVRARRDDTTDKKNIAQ